MRPHVPDLPPALRERTRPVAACDGLRDDGEFVVYWMRTAVRGHENPALDATLTAARRLGVPAFVYHALSERHPYANDRHHTFILKGAREVAAELGERGIAHAFHLERPGHRGPHLKTLAQRAALVVTEDLPVPPLRGWTESLAAASPAPVWAVDTACVVPMQLPGRPYERAYRYRRATGEARRERLERGWTDVEPEGEPCLPSDLPFEPVDLATADLPSLVAGCEIDHTVGPVPGTPGGTSAGYRRWRRFVEGGGLEGYAARRNDPLADGVSRLSPYLHYGQVSPLRIAREAAAVGGRGAEKYLDELLVWREMAHTWCFHHRDPERLSALPDWARETLRRHAGAPRPALYPWETLARAEVDEAGDGERLWNACQRALLIHGELHNNLRMTWGKALLGWTPDPQAALDLAVDLNHRYALDGRDPSSYGGILWCFGGFDRPFDPESAISGRVRGRSLDRHAGRLDVDRYARYTARPAVGDPPRVGVIGAGVAGLTCARVLADQGWLVTVVDKGRRPGGRTATRPGDVGHGGIDHGAQYFTARSDLFRRHVDSWRKMGLVAPWRGRIVELQAGGIRDKPGGPRRWVGVPGMDAVARHLAATFQRAGGLLHQGWRAEAVERRDGAWWFVGRERDADMSGGGAAAEAGPFGMVVTAVPPAQAVAFLAAAPELAAQVAAARVRPCWALLLTYDAPTGLPFDGAFVRSGPLSWVVRNSSKPGRGAVETWVLHAGPEWSREHLEDDPGGVVPALLAAFAEAAGRPLPEPAFVSAHRWRYALPDPPLDEPCLLAPDTGLAACGDWCGGPRVEGAFLSGAALAGRLLGRAAAG